MLNLVFVECFTIFLSFFSIFLCVIFSPVSPHYSWFGAVHYLICHCSAVLLFCYQQNKMCVSHLEQQQCIHRKCTPNNVWIIKENQNDCTSSQSPRILPLIISALVHYCASLSSSAITSEYREIFSIFFFNYSNDHSLIFYIWVIRYARWIVTASCLFLFISHPLLCSSFIHEWRNFIQLSFVYFDKGL